MNRVAVILHERLGNWNRQLRSRLHDLPIRWFETRSTADLDSVLPGLACPVVVIDLSGRALAGLRDLDRVSQKSPAARVLILDPDAHEEVAGLSRELGATHVISGFALPPFVAKLLSRWVLLAHRQIECDGWSQTSFPETETEPWAWLADLPGDPRGHQPRSTPTAPRPMETPQNDNGPSGTITIDLATNQQPHRHAPLATRLTEDMT